MHNVNKSAQALEYVVLAKRIELAEKRLPAHFLCRSDSSESIALRSVLTAVAADFYDAHPGSEIDLGGLEKVYRRLLYIVPAPQLMIRFQEIAAAITEWEMRMKRILVNVGWQELAMALQISEKVDRQLDAKKAEQNNVIYLDLGTYADNMVASSL